MKKILAFVLAVGMILTLSACLEETAPQKETYETEEKKEEIKEEVKEEVTFSLNETAVFENLKITALEIKESAGEQFFTPEAGKVFVGVKFNIENISSETQSVSSLLLFNGYVDDVKCEYSFNASCAFSDGTLDGEIAAGKKMVGWYALEVPSEWSNIELDVKSDWLSSNAAKFVFTK